MIHPEADMADERKRRRWKFIGAALAMLMLAYCGGCALMCDEIVDIEPNPFFAGNFRFRTYPNKTISLLFAPAACIEAQVIRKEVFVVHPTGTAPEERA